MAEIEQQGRLPGHPQRTGIDHQIKAAGPVIESKIGWRGKMFQRHGMMVPRRGQRIEQRAGLGGIAPRQHDSKALPGQPRDNRPRRAAGADHPRHAEQVRLRQRARQRFEKSGRVGIVPGEQAIAVMHHRIDRADQRAKRIEPVKQGDDRLFVRHGDIAAAPQRIGAPGGEVIGQPLSGLHMAAVIFARQPQLPQPIAMDLR